MAERNFPNPHQAVAYAVFDKTTQLCPRCDGYGWRDSTKKKARFLCDLCHGIGNIGGDIVEMRSTAARGGSSEKLLALAKEKRLRAEGRPANM